MVNGGGRSGEHFSEFMTRERDRLRAQREEVFNQQQELQRKLDEINREFAAIEAYETAKTGKAARGGSVRPAVSNAFVAAAGARSF